jgi:hypothetical protein
MVFALHNAQAHDGFIHLEQRLVVPLIRVLGDEGGTSMHASGGKSTLKRVANRVESGFVLLVVPFIVNSCEPPFVRY